MSNFAQWFNRALTTGDTSPISLGMSPEQVMSILGEPENKMAPRDDPGTIFLLFYHCPEGAMQFDFTNDKPGSPWTGEELMRYEEIGKQKRIVSERTYL